MLSFLGKPNFCFLEEDPGICRGLITRYFYNNQSKQCEQFKYGGCLGNQNNFETLDACRSTCEDPGELASHLGWGGLQGSSEMRTP